MSAKFTRGAEPPPTRRQLPLVYLQAWGPRASLTEWRRGGQRRTGGLGGASLT